MPEELEHLSEDEKLKAENEYLKMKLMLERGATFVGSEEQVPISAELENIFLNNILDFENEMRKQKKVRVFEKLGRPQHFREVSKIPDNQIDMAWRELQDYMLRHGIGLDVCSPNIGPRELYRFTMEELFGLETEDIQLPGWMTSYIYDEFHPDANWEATRTATHDGVHFILDAEPVEWMHRFMETGIRLNDHQSLSQEEFKMIVNRFKAAYDRLEVGEIITDNCTISGKKATVLGRYRLSVSDGKSDYSILGHWKVVSFTEDDPALWRIAEIDIEGISF